MAKEFFFRSWFIGQLRRMYRRYPPYYTVLNANKTIYYVKSKHGKDMKRVSVDCRLCGGVFKLNQVQIDHIIPVIDPKTGFPLLSNGEDDWITYLKRYYCDISNLQRICKPCHLLKTGKENKKRTKRKKKVKIS